MTAKDLPQGREPGRRDIAPEPYPNRAQHRSGFPMLDAEHGAWWQVTDNKNRRNSKRRPSVGFANGNTQGAPDLADPFRRLIRMLLMAGFTPSSSRATTPRTPRTYSSRASLRSSLFAGAQTARSSPASSRPSTVGTLDTSPIASVRFALTEDGRGAVPTPPSPPRTAPSDAKRSSFRRRHNTGTAGQGLLACSPPPGKSVSIDMPDDDSEDSLDSY